MMIHQYLLLMQTLICLDMGIFFSSTGILRLSSVMRSRLK